jgi:hypothetical protein
MSCDSFLDLTPYSSSTPAVVGGLSLRSTRANFRILDRSDAVAAKKVRAITARFRRRIRVVLIAYVINTVLEAVKISARSAETDANRGRNRLKFRD